MLIRDADGSIDNAHLYGFILVMRRLLTKDEFADFMSRLCALAKKYPFVSMRYYGFRDDWEAML